MVNKRNDFTNQLFIDAGIKEGMRVLDVGCGIGEVTMLVANIVGSKGEVVGFDISENAVKTATNLALERQIPNVQFLVADINSLPRDLKQFDAIVGRRVLMYLPNAIDSLKALLSYLKSGGMMIFQEIDAMASGISSAKLPLHAQAQEWIWNTILKENGNIHMGLELYSTFVQVGLKVQQIKAEAVLQTVETGSDLAWLIKMMAQRIIKSGVASSKEIGIDTLEERLLFEREKANEVFVRDMVFGICAVK